MSPSLSFEALIGTAWSIYLAHATQASKDEYLMVRWRVLAVTTITAANNGVNSLVLGLSGVLPSISSMNHHSKCMRKALTLSLWGWEFTDLLKVTWSEWWHLCLLRWAGPRLC